MSEIELQRAYYERTAISYDSMHGCETHPLALALLSGAIDVLGAKSVLGIGSGTGRILEHVGRRHRDVHAIGIEPVAALRAIGYGKGISERHLIKGDATRLPYADGEFDLVCSFGVLHHIRKPQDAVSEMLRIASKAIFISDSNNLGQGQPLIRLVKQTLHALWLWPLANLVKTRGRGYIVSEGDGISYSYSLFRNYRQISRQCTRVHIMNLDGSGRCCYRDSGSVVLIGMK